MSKCVKIVHFGELEVIGGGNKDSSYANNVNNFNNNSSSNGKNNNQNISQINNNQ